MLRARMSTGTKRDLHRTTFRMTGSGSSSGEPRPSIALTITYHPQLERIGERAFLGEPLGKPTELSRLEPEFVAAGASHGEPLNDGAISRTPIEFITMADGGVQIDMGNCTTFLTISGQRITGKVALSEQDIVRGVVIAVGKRVVLLLHSIPALDDVWDSRQSSIAPELVGTSVGLRRVLLDIQNVADTDKHVLIRGETGSGKELVAHALHRAGARREKPFVPLNMASMVKERAAADLFGAKKGSYTGSVERQVGHFEQASGGTLFLDEIGALEKSVQETLLRTLEQGEIQTLGASQVRKVDVRVISATDADLESKVESGLFSAALFNRLASFHLYIPPLRERRDDIGLLLARFLREELANVGESRRLEMNDEAATPWLPASIVAKLIDYDWPGNIRELKNVVGQIVLSNRHRERVEIPAAIQRQLDKQPVKVKLQPADVIPPLSPPPPPNLPVAPEPMTAPPGRKPADVTENELRDVLRGCRWDLNAASKQLRISRASMYVLKERFTWFRVAGDVKVEEIQQCHAACGGNLNQMAERLEVSEQALKRRIRELGLVLDK